jgi:hypothetical protein
MERERIDLLHGAIDGTLIAGAGRNLPRSDEIAVDLRLLSAADVTGTTGMAFGLWPAWRASRTPLALNMQTAGARQRRPVFQPLRRGVRLVEGFGAGEHMIERGEPLGHCPRLESGKNLCGDRALRLGLGRGFRFGLRLPSRGRVRHLDPERDAQLVPRSFSAPGGPASAWTGFTLNHLPTTNRP